MGHFNWPLYNERQTIVKFDQFCVKFDGFS